jgi:hypothetical protein
MAIPEFVEFLSDTTGLLNESAEIDAVSEYSGARLEERVFEKMERLTSGPKFQELRGRLFVTSGLIFTCSGADKIYGVEVKSSKNDSWMTTDDIDFEGNGVRDVKNVFLLFGKLSNPPEFRFRPYGECVGDVRVTHTPRYAIDMNLKTGDTFFDKAGVTFDEFRSSGDKMKTIKEYYSGNNPKQHQWPFERDKGVPVNLVFFNDLSKSERAPLLVQGLVRFPELLASPRGRADGGMKKYERFTLWLLRERGIICHNIRDAFSAGGKLGPNYPRFEDAPAVFKIFFDEKDRFKKAIADRTRRAGDVPVENGGSPVGVFRRPFFFEWFKEAVKHAKPFYFRAEELLRSVFFDPE